MFRFLLAALALILCCSCSTVVTNPADSKVKEATADQVSGCKFLQTLSGTSSFYGFFAASAMRDIREKIMESADSLGGTHVVFISSESNKSGTSMHAKAFKCYSPTS